MTITDNQLLSIKNIIQEFIDNNALKNKEEHVQTSYTIPILEILNWKKTNWKINESQDVKTSKRPDILLKGSGGGTIFVLESKEPSLPNGLDGKYPKWTFEEQICFYCGSEGVSWGALTDFKEWRIYNHHSFLTNRTYYKKLVILKDNKIVCTDEQLKEFFSLIDYSFLNSCKGKISKDTVYYKKESEIKEEFFQNLKEWRKNLRNFILKTYHSLTTEQIDYNTQKILDRLIFMDVCYDKGIISQDILGSILFSGKLFYDELKRKFRDFDDKYNSELFAIEECDNFNIPNIEIESIIKGINYTDFSNLSVHIIGEVYENYLGELLKTGKQSATSESKEHLKRKSQGIYYTPDYIVNYIVDNTVGELLKKCKTSQDIEKIKVIDTACGSGSFLIRTFDVFYEAYKSKKEYKNSNIFNELELRKRILLHNIFGVDLDQRAVEIAKLNLLLRALDGLPDLDTNMKERKILPNLSLNIRCGNSLVSGTYKSESIPTENNPLGLIFDSNSEHKENIRKLLELKKEFYEEEDNLKKDKLIETVKVHEEIINKYLNKTLKHYFKDIEKIKPFNYDVAFCEVMKNGGFNCVIGNPPFVVVKGGRYTGFEENKNVIDYYKNNYVTLQQQINIYIAFLEKSNKLLKEDGFVGLIIPNTILTNDYCVDIRKYLLKNTYINILNNVGQVFSGAVVETLVIVFSKNNKSNINTALTTAIYQKKENKIKQTIFNKIYLNRFLLHLTKPIISIIDKCDLAEYKLKNIADVWRGLTTGDDKKYLNEKKLNDNYKKIIQGKQINRFFIEDKELYVNYLIDELDRPRKKEIFEQKEKIISKFIGKQLEFAYDNKKLFVINTGVVIYLHKLKDYNIKYLLGILNSKLINFYFFNLFTDYRDVFPIIKSGHLEELPIKSINFKNKTEKLVHDKLVKLVNEMLVLNKNPEKNKIKISATDIEIDSLVYKLYDIGVPEQNIIEESLKKK